jgi:acyl dehydratase
MTDERSTRPEPKVLSGLDDVRAAVGSHLGYSEWLIVEQDRVQMFADATGDDEWLHLDVERATASSFGGPIAHGFLTMALSNFFLPQIFTVSDVSAGVNYGTNKLRFPAPVRPGDRIRAGAFLVECTDVPGGVQTTTLITIELDGSVKPACTIESLSRWLA